jgi:hypothetical protein
MRYGVTYNGNTYCNTDAADGDLTTTDSDTAASDSHACTTDTHPHADTTDGDSHARTTDADTHTADVNPFATYRYCMRLWLRFHHHPGRYR